MKGDRIPDSDHVVRYIKPTALQGARIDGSELRIRMERPDETGLSVTWFEYFVAMSKDEQVAEARRHSILNMSKQGCLAELNVGRLREHISSYLPSILVIEDPVLPTSKYPLGNPAHAQIVGVPPADDDMAMLIGDMIAECIVARHPTV